MSTVDRYLREMEAAVRAISRDEVRAVVDALHAAWRRGARVYIVGNGGSASTASHMMNDLCKATRVPGAAPLRAFALADNVALLTAVANDVSYDEVFSYPLEGLIAPGDVLVVVSGSGDSPNVLRACERARAAGAQVVALLGRPGGKALALADVAVLVPADRIGQQEDGHLIVNHAVTLALRERIEASVAAAAAVPTVLGETGARAFPA